MTGGLHALKDEGAAGRKKWGRDLANLAGRRERVPPPEGRALTVLPGPDRLPREEAPSRRSGGLKANGLPEFAPPGRNPGGRPERSPAHGPSRKAHAPNVRPVAKGPTGRNGLKERSARRDATQRPTVRNPHRPVQGGDPRERLTTGRFPEPESSREATAPNVRPVANGPTGRLVRKSAPKDGLRAIPPKMKDRIVHGGRASERRDDPPPLPLAL